jgi:pSer/pThr/pTyr-binding forkhead associated (FHA) protein
MHEDYLLHFLKFNKVFLLEEDITAGVSRRHCNLNLTDYLEGPITTISRRHFRISDKDQHIFIEDLGSKNGTKVNDERLLPHKPRRLFDGDIIKIADYDKFTMELVSGGTRKTGQEGKEADKSEPIPEDGVYFKEDEETFYVDGQAIHEIPPIVFDLLKHLYDNLNKVCSHYDLIQDVWGGGADKSTSRAAIYKLRHKLNESSKGAGKRYIKASQGYGYKLIRE